MLGAVLCSLVILLFLGQWRMTAIAVMTIPISVLAAVACLYATGQTINVMTLAGLALAIGPLVDSAIICLENTHRHLGLGASPEEAAYLGASEVALPELVSTLCTFLVLAPLAFMPGLGAFLFRPMAMAVAFAMIAAYFLSRTFVPSRSARWLRPHVAHIAGTSTEAGCARAFARWEALIDRGIAAYVRRARCRPAEPRCSPSGWPSPCWPRPWSRSARVCVASSSPRSTPGPSRSTPGPRAAPGSRSPRRRSSRSRRTSASGSATTCN